MERYNYTAAGMVPADGGDWVKVEDVIRLAADLEKMPIQELAQKYGLTVIAAKPLADA